MTCHYQPINDVHDNFPGLLDESERGDWQSPVGIDWSKMTPRQRCETTVSNLSKKIDPVYNVNFGLVYNAVNHFMRDPRVVWAVTHGAPHGFEPGCDPYNPVCRILPKAFPQDRDRLFQLVTDWLGEGAVCDVPPEGRYRIQNVAPPEPADYHYP